jgi:hypothetical protein
LGDGFRQDEDDVAEGGDANPIAVGSDEDEDDEDEDVDDVYYDDDGNPIVPITLPSEEDDEEVLRHIDEEGISTLLSSCRLFSAPFPRMFSRDFVRWVPLLLCALKICLL